MAYRYLTRRTLSSILSPNSTTPLTTKQKSRSALSLLKSTTNPETIISICRAAALTPDSHLDRIAFSLAITQLTKANAKSHIRSYIEELGRERIDLKGNEKWMKTAMRLYAKAGMVDDVMRTYKGCMASGTEEVHVVNGLLEALLEGKMYEEMSKVFKEFSEEKKNLNTYNLMIRGYSESGKTSSGYEILEKMKEKGLEATLALYGYMVSGFYKEENVKEVEKVMKMLKEEGNRNGDVSLSMYNVRILSLCKLGKSGDAKDLFDEMVKKGVYPNGNTYKSLVFGLGKEGKLDDAMELFKKAKTGSKTDNWMYFGLIHNMCKAGNYDGALEVCKESLAKNWVPRFPMMKDVVEGLVKNEKVDEAKELIAKMKEKFEDKAAKWDEVEANLPS